jgi:hypothetical protein
MTKMYHKKCKICHYTWNGPSKNPYLCPRCGAGNWKNGPLYNKNHIISYSKIKNKKMFWYTLGLHFADGCCNSYNNHGTISISQKYSKSSVHILNKIKKWILYNRIFHKNSKGKMIYSKCGYDPRPRFGKFHSITLGIGALWLKILWSRYGYVKTTPYQNLKRIDKKYKHYFMAGIIDGDGSISKDKSCNSWRIAISCCSKKTAKNIKRMLEKWFGLYRISIRESRTYNGCDLSIARGKRKIQFFMLKETLSHLMIKYKFERGKQLMKCYGG